MVHVLPMSLKLREIMYEPGTGQCDTSTFGPGDIAKGRVSHITVISIAFPNVDSYQTKDFFPQLIGNCSDENKQGLLHTERKTK